MQAHNYLKLVQDSGDDFKGLPECMGVWEPLCRVEGLGLKAWGWAYGLSSFRHSNKALGCLKYKHSVVRLLRILSLVRPIAVLEFEAT